MRKCLSNLPSYNKLCYHTFIDCRHIRGDCNEAFSKEYDQFSFIQIANNDFFTSHIFGYNK